VLLTQFNGQSRITFQADPPAIHRSSNANIFPATLKTRAVSLKGKPSVTPGFEMQYSLISSTFIVILFYLRLGNPDSDCNWLPFPMLPFLDDMSQTRKWKMKSKHQRILGCGPVEEMTPGGHDLIRSKIDRRAPFRLF